MAKYNFDFKLKIVSEYLEGKIGLNSLGEKHDINPSQVKRWVNNYKIFGIEGLKRSRKKNSYSVELKLEVLALYEASEMSYREVANEFGITNPSMIANWRKRYQEYGIDGLSAKRGRPRKMKEDNKKPKKKEEEINIPSDELEEAKNKIQELEHENHMLKIKTEYLELLRSLRLKEKMKLNQESSTNSEKDTY